MKQVYQYGPLKSFYFSNFDKIWIEGFCKDNNISLTEKNLSSVLGILHDKGTPSVKNKIKELLEQAAAFSNYAKDSFNNSWNRILGFSMKRVQPKESLRESDLEGAKAASKWWLKDAPNICKDIIAKSCFENIIIECLMNDGLLLEKLKDIDLVKDKDTILKIRPSSVLESIDKTKGKKFNSFEGTKSLLEFEPALQFIPEAENLINALAWTAENIKKIENFKK